MSDTTQIAQREHGAVSRTAVQETAGRMKLLTGSR